jgi:hypothetical protein
LKDIEIEDKLCTFVRDFCDDLSSIELMLFFSRHPHARFNHSAVSHVLTSKRFDAAITLKRLVEKKIVITYTENGITLYALTKQEPIHSLAAQLITIDQRQWQVIVEQILTEEGIQ